METFGFTEDSSTKNIPIPGAVEYLKQLVYSIEKLINKCRFKVEHFEKEFSTDPKIRNEPPKHPDTQISQPKQEVQQLTRLLLCFYVTIFCNFKQNKQIFSNLG